MRVDIPDSLLVFGKLRPVVADWLKTNRIRYQCKPTHRYHNKWIHFRNRNDAIRFKFQMPEFGDGIQELLQHLLTTPVPMGRKTTSILLTNDRPDPDAK